MSDPEDDVVARSMALLDQIERLLVGQGPEVQGAVLHSLTATWVCGHHPEIRRIVMAQHFELIRDAVRHHADKGTDAWTQASKTPD